MRDESLTLHEGKVLQLLAEGLSTRDIAKKLGRSYNTIAWYRQQIRAKFGVKTTAAVLTIASQQGILQDRISSPSPTSLS